MYHDVHVVHRHPQTRLLAFDAPYLFAELLLDGLLHAVGDRRDLHGRIGVANDEMRTDGAVESRKVQRYNILTFFILNRTDYRPVSYTHLDVYKRQPRGGRPRSGGTAPPPNRTAVPDG